MRTVWITKYALTTGVTVRNVPDELIKGATLTIPSGFTREPFVRSENRKEWACSADEARASVCWMKLTAQIEVTTESLLGAIGMTVDGRISSELSKKIDNVVDGLLSGDSVSPLDSNLLFMTSNTIVDSCVRTIVSEIESRIHGGLDEHDHNKALDVVVLGCERQPSLIKPGFESMVELTELINQAINEKIRCVIVTADTPPAPEAADEYRKAR